MQISQFNPNRPAFKGEILVLKPKKFNLLPLKQYRAPEKHVGAPWTMEESKILPQGFTGSMMNCTAAYIHNKTTGLLTHLIPGDNDPAEVSRFIAKHIDELRKTGGNLKAFLTGGKKGLEISREIYDAIKRPLIAGKVPFSSIWGAPECMSTDMFVSAKKSRYMITTRSMVEQPVINDVNDLKGLYEEVILNDDVITFDK